MGYDERDHERYVAEPAKPASAGGALARRPFVRDRARVLHSAALRRLAAKTQVVGLPPEGDPHSYRDDFPRTRLTHSLECAQIGRELGEALGADPDLVDAACLAHDLGHPPFGHTGETALDALAGPCGGFEGNAQSLRILTRLEAKVVDPAGAPAGLNLTRATLDAATKYPWPRSADLPKYGVYVDDRAVFDWFRLGAPGRRRCLEAQVMDWADDVAYSVHDLEDGVHAGHVQLQVLADGSERAALCETAHAFLLDDCPGSPDLPDALKRLLAQPELARWVDTGYDGSARATAALKATTSELIGRFSSTAVVATQAAYGAGPLRRYTADLVVPAVARLECALLKAVAARYVMSRPAALASHERERRVIAELVGVLLDRAPDELDGELRPVWEQAGDEAARLRVVIDQVAQLTDTSALAWHARLVHRRGGELLGRRPGRG